MPVAAVIAVFSLVIGLAVLVLVTFTVYEQVKSLGRTVARASDRLGGAMPPPGGAGAPRTAMGDRVDDDVDFDFG